MAAGIDESAVRALPSAGAETLDDAALEDRYAAPEQRWARANLVVSLDGAVELGGRAQGLSGAADQRVFAALRALADVVVVGANTVKAENYGRARVSSPRRGRREARAQTPIPPIAVLTNRADLDPDARLFTEGEPRPLVCTCEAAPAVARDALAGRAEVVMCGAERVDPGLALGELRARGLDHVLCEGGPTIVSALLAGGHLDELCLTHSPVIAGPGHLELTTGVSWPAAVATRLTHLVEGGGMLFGRYRVHRGDPR